MSESVAERLEYLRRQIRAERISYSELLELQGLAEHIEPGDVELLEWAGVPEQHHRWRLQALELGKCAGEAAGSWAADGNTTRFHASRVLAMLADGDPAAYDFLPRHPDLSGEWADDLTPVSLAREIIGDDDFDEMSDDARADVTEELSTLWEQGVSDAFEDACERELRSVIQ